VEILASETEGFFYNIVHLEDNEWNIA
jgi:hypothetical protein